MNTSDSTDCMCIEGASNTCLPLSCVNHHARMAMASRTRKHARARATLQKLRSADAPLPLLRPAHRGCLAVTTSDKRIMAQVQGRCSCTRSSAGQSRRLRARDWVDDRAKRVVSRIGIQWGTHGLYCSKGPDPHTLTSVASDVAAATGALQQWGGLPDFTFVGLIPWARQAETCIARAISLLGRTSEVR